MNYINQLESLGACPQAIGWLKLCSYPSLHSAWDACENTSWMMWLQFMLSKPDTEERKAVLRVLLIRLNQGAQDHRPSISAAFDAVDRLCKDEASYSETVDALNNIEKRTDGGARSIISKLLLLVTDEPDVHMANWVGSTCDEPGVLREDTLSIIRRHFPNPPVLE